MDGVTGVNPMDSSWALSRRLVGWGGISFYDLGADGALEGGFGFALVLGVIPESFSGHGRNRVQWILGW